MRLGATPPVDSKASLRVRRVSPLAPAWVCPAVMVPTTQATVTNHATLGTKQRPFLAITFVCLRLFARHAMHYMALHGLRTRQPVNYE